jgi:hypothetical protein
MSRIHARAKAFTSWLQSKKEGDRSHYPLQGNIHNDLETFKYTLSFKVSSPPNSATLENETPTHSTDGSH